jgi:hypothetical protein
MNPNRSRYRLELIIAGMAAIGLLLLVIEPHALTLNGAQIRTGLGSALAEPVRRVNVWLDMRLGDVSWAEQVGAILLAAAALFFALRLRWRFIHASRYSQRVCPRCGGQLARVHRTSGDRLLGAVLFLPLARYLCHNPECRWQGLRIGSTRRRQAHKRP